MTPSEIPSKPCERCGVSFDKRPTTSRAAWEKVRFCSYACRKNPLRSCGRCGIPVTVRGERVEQDNVYCSRKCANADSVPPNRRPGNIIPRPVITCQTCEASFSVIPARATTAKFCSKSCLGKSNGSKTRKPSDQ